MSNQTGQISPVPTERTGHPHFMEAFWFWLKLGFISFGGPTGQIAIMHSELVERRKWISESRFLHALNYCMLLPGPEAQQLAVYIGWLLHKTWGGIIAGTFFVLPGALVLWGLSYVYVSYGDVQWVSALFDGLKPAVLAIVAAAVIRIGKKVLKNEVMWTIAALAFVGIFFLGLPFPLIVLSALVLGFFGGKIWPAKFQVIRGHGPDKGGEVLGDESESGEHTRRSWGRSLKVVVICLVLWWAPVIGLGSWLGWNHTLVEEGFFFSKAAMVTFGGAYAVLPYVSQQAVERHGWLGAGQMLDGLGLAETTPGPLILVLQFVGFLGAWNFPGTLSPLWAATLGAFITTWTTFVPCFLWIFLGGPHIEALRGNVRLSTALSAVTAAVVGVILNLAVWFGWHLLLPAPGEVDWFSLALSIGIFIGIMRWNWNVIAVVAGAGAVGVVWFWVTG
jgi:chromate transporter